MTTTPRVLYVMTCATLAATKVDVLIRQALAAGWDVWVTSTPQGINFIDTPTIEELTGHPVRSQYRHHSQPKQAPPAHAVIVAGASLNTINKWAAGIADNLALSTLIELMGTPTPIALLPFVNSAMAAHPAFTPNMATLGRAGVHVLLGPGVYVPHPPHTAAHVLPTYPWHLALDTVEAARTT